MNEVKLKLSVEGGQVVSASIDGVTTRLDKLDSGARAASVGTGTLKQEMSALHMISNTVIGSLGSIAGGLSVVAVAAKAISVQREFDILNSSLITVTGSSMKAAQEFEWIKRFAATTPYQLNEVTGAFVKMKALGLDASEKALTSYGNTASAMGKGINQMIEAVADASTGEFERLKEFGIKAKQNGDQVSLTFQGVTTSIGNNANEITQYLQNIGNVEFAGAMEERAKTLDGAISNLADTWDELFRTVNQNATGSVIYDSVTLASKAISDAITIIGSMNDVTAENAKQTGAMATVQASLGAIFETVAVLGANVKYTLVAVGNELGGMAAQAVQILQGNFSGAAAIRQSMISDGEIARREIDATTERILGARKAAQDFSQWATRNASANTDVRRIDAYTPVKDVASASKKEINEAAKALEFYNSLMDQASGYSKSYAEDQNKLALALKNGSITYGQYTEAVQKLLAQQPLMANAAKAEAEWQKEAAKAYDETVAAAEKSAASVQDQLAQQLEHNAVIGLTVIAIAELEAEKLRDQAITKDSLALVADQIDWSGRLGDKYRQEAQALRDLASAKVSGAQKQASVTAAADMMAEQKKAAEESSKYWDDALMRAFEHGKGFFESLWDTIKNTLKTQTLKVGVLGVMSFAGIGTSSAAQGLGAVGGMGNALSSLSTLGGISNAATLGYGSMMGSATTALLGQTAGNAAIATAITGSSGAAVAAAAAAAEAGGAAAATAASAASMGATFAAAVPWVGGALVVAKLLSGPGFTSASDSGRARIDYGADGTGGAAYSTTGSAAQIATMTATTNALAASYFDTAKSLGITAIKGAFEVGTNTGREGANPNTVIGATFGSSGYSSGEVSSSDTAGLQLAASRAVLTALQASQLPTYLSGVFDNITASTATQDQITAALSGATALKQFHDALLGLPFQNLAGLSYAATQSLIGFSGSLDALQTNLGTYYSNFYSSEEQRLQTIQNINTATAGSGLDAATATRDSFRSLVEAQDLNTESGRKMYATLIGVAGAFAGITSTSTAAATSVSNVSKALESLKSKGTDLADQYDKLTMTQEAYRAKTIAGYTAEEKAQALANFAIEDSITAYNANAAAITAAADAAKAASQAYYESASTLASNALNAVNRAVDAQRKIYQVQVSAAQSAVTEISSVFNVLKSNIDALYGSTSGKADQGNAFIDQALATALATGYLPDSTQLADAITAARAGVDSTIYASQKDADFARLALAGKLDQLKNISGQQLTGADRALSVAQSQLTALDDIASSAQAQLDATNGNSSALLSVADALRAFGLATGALANARTSQGLDTVASSESLRLGYAHNYIKQVYDGSTASLINIAGKAQANGYTQADLASSMGLPVADVRKLFDTAGIPAFAGGGYHAGGLAMVGEDGPEIVNFAQPAQIYTAGQTSSMLGGNTARLESLVEGLTKEVQRLQGLVDAGNSHAARYADTLEKVTDGGNAMRSEIMAPIPLA